MHDYNNPAAPIDPETFEAAKRSCEVDVVLEPGLAAEIEGSLDYDHRPQGSRGRALTTKVGAMLQAGDRLEWI